jgi:hypothetical protein
MTTVNIEALVIRRSENTNSFGLRGIWIITTNARRVFEFACSALDAQRYQIGDIVQVPFRLNADKLPHAPAHELVQHKGNVPAVDVLEFLGLFNDTLADKWNAHKAANAIEAAN